MAITHAGTATKTIDNDGNTTVTSGSISFSANDLCIATGAYFTSTLTTVLSVKLDGGTSFTIDKQGVNVNGQAVFIASLAGVSAGSHTVTVTFVLGVEACDLFVSRFAGAATSSPADGTGAGPTTGTSALAASGTFTTSNSDSLFIGVCATGSSANPATVTVGTNVAWAHDTTNGRELNGAANIVGGMEYFISTATTSSDAQFTTNNTDWEAAAFAYKVAAGAAANPFVTTIGAQVIPVGKPNYSAICSFVLGTALTLTQLASTPFVQTDWTLPVRARSAPIAALTHTQARPQFYQDIKPFSQTEWPRVTVPRRSAVSNLTHLHPRPQFYADIKPFAQTAWPLPRVPATLLSVTIGTRPPLDTVAAVALPASLTDWPLPQAKPWPIALRTWVQERKTYYADIQPFSQTSWPPGRAVPPAVGLTSITQSPEQGVLSLPVGGIPTGQTVLTLPLTRPVDSPTRLTWTQWNVPDQSALFPGIPQVNYDWPIPPRPKPQPITKLTHVAYYVYDTTDAIPGFLQPLPLVKPYPISLRTWVQSKPTYLAAATLPVGRQIEWPIPPRPQAEVRTWTQSLTTSTLGLTVASPFVPLLWTVPDRSVRVITLQTWTQNLIASTLAPEGWALLIGGQRNHLVREIT